jgi:hypothetical protein
VLRATGIASAISCVPCAVTDPTDNTTLDSSRSRFAEEQNPANARNPFDTGVLGGSYQGTIEYPLVCRIRIKNP